MSIKSESDSMSQAYVLGAEDANRARNQELEELRDLCDSQARIIEAMQKQLDIAHRVEFAKRRAPRDASRNFSG
jgi:hypothetical protein